MASPPVPQSGASHTASAVHADDTPPRQLRLRMVKQAGDRSFGMTLEQRYVVSPHEYAAVVSFIFPNSPADRVGIKRGWMLLRINDASVRGVPVKDVALMFRDQMEVDIELEARPYSAQSAPLLGGFSAAGAASFGAAVVNGFSRNKLLFRPSLTQLPVPAPLPAAAIAHPAASTQDTPATACPPSPIHPTPVARSTAAAAVSTTPGRVISSPGSSLGIPASLVDPVPASTAHAVAPRTVTAPSMPALSGFALEPQVQQQSVAQAGNTANAVVEIEPQSAAPASDTPQQAPVVAVARVEETVVALTPSGQSATTVIATPLTTVAGSGSANESHPDTTVRAAPVRQSNSVVARADPSQPEATKPTLAAAAVAPTQTAPTEIVTTPAAAVTPPKPNSTPAPAPPPASVRETIANNVAVAAAAQPPAAPPAQMNHVKRNGVVSKPAPREIPPATATKPVPREHSHSNGSTPSSSVAPAARPASPDKTQTTTTRSATTPASGKKRARPTSATSHVHSEDEDAYERAPVKPRHLNNAIPNGSGSDSSTPRSSHSSCPSLPHIDLDPRSPPEQPSRRNTRRRGSSGSRQSSGRARTSLTVDRLVTMGFTREDANASVTACGHDPDACMLWIISHMEEKQFFNDMDQASIQSELSRRAEEEELKQQEHETLKKAKEFTALFSTSFMLSSESDATLFKKMLSDAIGEVNPDSFLRVELTKLLKLEAQAIRWYKDASKCYLLQLAERLEASFTGHDAVQCCSKLMGGADASSRIGGGCAFLQTLCEEAQSLSKALFDMPENHGGVPLAFLKADKDMQFSLDNDGFEVLEVELASDE